MFDMLIKIRRAIANAKALKLQAHVVFIVERVIDDFDKGGNFITSGLLREYQLAEDDSTEQSHVIWEMQNAVHDWIFLDCDFRNSIRDLHCADDDATDEKAHLEWYAVKIVRMVLRILSGEQDLEPLQAEIRFEFERLLE
jgi:hypothetical protein